MLRSSAGRVDFDGTLEQTVLAPDTWLGLYRHHLTLVILHILLSSALGPSNIDEYAIIW